MHHARILVGKDRSFFQEQSTTAALHVTSFHDKLGLRFHSRRLMSITPELQSSLGHLQRVDQWKLTNGVLLSNNLEQAGARDLFSM